MADHGSRSKTRGDGDEEELVDFCGLGKVREEFRNVWADGTILAAEGCECP